MKAGQLFLTRGPSRFYTNRHHVSFMSVDVLHEWQINITLPDEWQVTCFCPGHVLMLLQWCCVYGSCVVFNKKLMDNCVPKTMTRTFLNQKPWVDKSIYNALRTNTTAYSSQSVTWGNTRLPLIKSTERNLTPQDSHRDQVPSQTVMKNPRALWLEN